MEVDMPAPTAKQNFKPHTGSRTASTASAVTIRTLPWSYIHLTLLPSNPTAAGVAKADPIDEITARTHLTSALTQFLGLNGSAIAIDILKVCGRDFYIRTPREDASAVVEAAAGWVGPGDTVSLRVNSRSTWLGALLAGDGRGLFKK